MWHFSDLQYGFRSTRSTVDLLIVVSDRIARAFNMFRDTRAVALDISKALFLLFSVKGSFEWFWMEGLHKNIQLMLEFLKAPFLFQHFSCYTLMTFLMILFSTLNVIRHLTCGSN